jgi:hypothetical protein
MDLKAQGASQQQKGEAVHRWYAQDKSATLQKELIALFSALKNQEKSPA